jgi:hypothetical protein
VRVDDAETGPVDLLLPPFTSCCPHTGVLHLDAIASGGSLTALEAGFSLSNGGSQLLPFATLGFDFEVAGGPIVADVSLSANATVEGPVAFSNPAQLEFWILLEDGSPWHRLACRQWESSAGEVPCQHVHPENPGGGWTLTLQPGNYRLSGSGESRPGSSSAEATIEFSPAP